MLSRSNNASSSRGTTGLVLFLILSGMATVAISVLTVKKLTIDRAVEDARVYRDISVEQLKTAKEMERIVELLEARAAENKGKQK